MRRLIERGESVKLTGFGNFQLRDKAERPGRNPKTGVEVNIPVRRVVTFRASQKRNPATDESAKKSKSEHVDGYIRACPKRPPRPISATAA